ncbi:hypothetical protein F5Y18DRAFT_421444 [Xylariaceae sp. FL1019]|nr:hypothetical protein F5Y18DRAFT_421444 [Xylariaceae sp. FL1019]
MAFPLSEASTCGQQLVTTEIVFQILSTAFLALRFWSAIRSCRSFCADDILICLAYASVASLGGVVIWGVLNGMGKRLAELTPAQLVIQVKALLAIEFTYLSTTVFAKLSVIWLLKRIYETRTFKRLCYGLIALNLFYYLSFTIIYLTNCIPISEQWHHQPGGYCRSTTTGDYATIGTNLFLDVLNIVLPLPVLWGLKMSIKDKITITAMFSLGTLTIATLVWRLVLTIQVRSSPEWVLTLCQVGCIAQIELHVSIIAACIPTLGPLFNAYIKPLLAKLSIVGSSLGRSGSGSKDATVKLNTLHTIGSSRLERRPGMYSEVHDSQDQILEDHGSIKLRDKAEGTVTAACGSGSINDEPLTRPPSRAIYVRTNIEATYHTEDNHVH